MLAVWVVNTRTGSVIVALLLVTAIASSAGAATVSSSHSGWLTSSRGGASTLKVGTRTLARCSGSQRAYCGTLSVPLDWGQAKSPHISVCFRWYPATGPGRPAGTVLPVEGGPGYPSIASVGQDGYAAMYGALLRRFNMLVVDLRGTGCSSVLFCKRLQDFRGPPGSPRLAAVVGACAAGLDHRWRYPDGRFVRASDLFTSAASAQDVAAVIRVLRTGPVSLYGDSYGSWFAQVLASRYPFLVRSVVLDSTYPVQALDPWYRITIATLPADFDRVCRQSPPCARAGSSWQVIEELAARLRRRPVSGRVPGGEGTEVRTGLGVVGLVNLVSDSAEDPAIYASLDAAGRALLDDGDARPLLRLYASRLAFDEAYFGEPVASYSVELYMAVSCSDYPQLYPMHASPATRRRDLEAAIASLPASTFSPFTTREWLAMDQNTENYTACVDWPRPKIAEPPIRVAPPFLPGRMPVLILGGELDTWTPPAGVPEVVAELGGDTRFVEFANETHVVAEGDPYGCATSLVRTFVRAPNSLRHLDVACAARVPPIRAVAAFPDSLAAVAPVRIPHARGLLMTRRLAAAGIDTAGDALARLQSISGTRDDGLYGGRAVESGSTLRLTGDEFVPGVHVTGTVVVTGSGPRAVVRVSVRAAAATARVTVRASYLLYGGSGKASVVISSRAHRWHGSVTAPEGVPY